MTFRPKQSLIINFKSGSYPLRSGKAEVQSIINDHTIVVNLHNNTVILDLRFHGQQFTIKEVA